MIGETDQEGDGTDMRRLAAMMATLLAAGLWLWAGPASAGPGPAHTSKTKVGCVPAPVPPFAPHTLGCVVAVADADPGVDVDPTGTVGLFLDAINTPSFLGSCTLASAGGPGGISGCSTLVPPSPGPHTVWALYFGDGTYSASVDSDDVGNPPSGPPEPTDTGILCAATGIAGTPQPLDCLIGVADDDSDPVGFTAPSGTVGVFDDAINTPGFVGSCTLFFFAPGVAGCSALTTPIAPGPSIMWALYFGDGVYAASVDADPVTV